jgi:DNA-binding NarL/FixJ family response regulator
VRRLDEVNRKPKLPSCRLSSRETEILRLVALGLSTKEMARLLRRAEKTIEAHRSNVYRKQGLHSFLDAQALAIKWGLVKCPCKTTDGSEGDDEKRRD